VATAKEAHVDCWREVVPVDEIVFVVVAVAESKLKLVVKSPVAIVP